MSNRDSNIELLRILCMIGIVLMHFVGLALCPNVWNPHAALTSDVICSTLICSVTIYSVNVFGLISGYFGIKFSWKRLLKLYLCCSFYCLLGLLFCRQGGAKSELLEVLMPFSHNGNTWYISCYVGLLLMSPFLNKAIESMSKHEYQYTLILFAIVNVYLGRFWKVDSYNVYGYSVSQLVFLYIIGGYIRRYVTMDWMKLHRRGIIFVILGCIIIWNGLTIMQHFVTVPHWSPTSYNHVVILVGAVCVLMLFLTWSFQNRSVNWFASGSLAVYLFHQNPHIWSSIRQCVASLNISVYNLLLMIPIAVGISLIIVMLDHIRQWGENRLLGQLINKIKV